MLKIFLNRHLHLILEGFNVWILKKRFECWKYFWIDICCCMTSRVILLTLATAWHPCRYIAGYHNVHIQLGFDRWYWSKFYSMFDYWASVVLTNYCFLDDFCCHIWFHKCWERSGEIGRFLIIGSSPLPVGAACSFNLNLNLKSALPIA